MQLVVVLFLFFYANKFGLENEVRPLIRDIGGEEMDKVIGEAEEISSVISAIQGVFNGNDNLSDGQAFGGAEAFSDNFSGGSDNFFYNMNSEGVNCEGMNGGDVNREGANGEFGQTADSCSDGSEWLGNNFENKFENEGKENHLSEENFSCKENFSPIIFPLGPIIDIVDKDTAFCLAKFFAAEM
jgi:hypothetical protein